MYRFCRQSKYYGNVDYLIKRNLCLDDTRYPPLLVRDAPQIGICVYGIKAVLKKITSILI